MQTDSLTILVGPDQCAYKVPQGRLTMHSSVFLRMCCAPFPESTQRVIKLPEENPRVFDDFYAWMHSSKPRVDLVMGAQAIFDLAIFAEKYKICHLTNQISDLLKDKWSDNKVDAQILDRVYSSVPDGAVLRQRCAWILERMVEYHVGGFGLEGFVKGYEPVFVLHPDLGRDFFRATVTRNSDNFNSKPCAYHDHSNINSHMKDNDKICPYSAIHFETPLDNNGKRKRKHTT